MEYTLRGSYHCGSQPFNYHMSAQKAVIYSDDAVLCVFTQDSRSWRRSGIEKFHFVLEIENGEAASVVAMSCFSSELHNVHFNGR